jgi:TolB-like protein/Flp pilus assembly protein TadD/predicted Ser/Thr protein kinase
MGTVYRARDVELDEVVAVKVLRRDLDLGPTVIDRFRQEVRLTRRIAHRNVARMFDIYEDGEDRFLAMELVEGESLASLLAREGRQSVERAIALGAGICEGLSAAHAAGIVHRDLKPENVLLAPDGRVVLTDFGIARPLFGSAAGHSAGMTLGTPAYMAPEQVENRTIDERADIYALGGVLYQLFTGQLPWVGDSAIAVAIARLTSPPPDPRTLRPDLPAFCADAVLRCMARKAEDRFSSADEARAHLLGSEAPRESRPAPSAPTLRATLAPPPQPTAPVLKTACSVAVLFFRNAGPSEDAYLAEELTDDLIDGLCGIGQIRVRPRGAVLRYARTEVNPTDVGRELGVEVIVEGSVRRSGDRVRIHARLIHVDDGFQVWAKRFDRPASEVLEINDELVRAVAQALSVEADGGARAAPSNPAAIDLFLRGKHELRKVWPEHLARAIELFDQADALAPDTPLLLAAKASALARSAAYSGAGVEDARIAAERAVALAPTFAEARLALGNVLIQQGNGSAGLREILLALEIQPAFADAHAALGRILTETELMDEGVRYLELALAFDADHPIASAALARAYALRGDIPAALDVLQQHLLRAGRSYQDGPRARLLLWQRDHAGAEAMLAALDENSTVVKVARMFLRVALHRDLSEVEALEAASQREAKPRPFIFQVVSECLAAVGERDRALATLERYAAVGLTDIAWLERCPLFAELHGDPRFLAVQALVAPRAAEIARVYTAARPGQSSPPPQR